jgi:hypothetical protein
MVCDDVVLRLLAWHNIANHNLWSCSSKLTPMHHCVCVFEIRTTTTLHVKMR